MSDFKIKVGLELDYDLKEKIDEYVRESILKEIQTKRIEDLTSEDNKCTTVILRTRDSEYLETRVISENNCSEIIYESNTIHIKFKGEN